MTLIFYQDPKIEEICWKVYQQSLKDISQKSPPSTPVDFGVLAGRKFG